MMEKINKEDIYDCCYVNIEPAQAARGNVEKGICTIDDTLWCKGYSGLQDSHSR